MYSRMVASVIALLLVGFGIGACSEEPTDDLVLVEPPMSTLNCETQVDPDPECEEEGYTEWHAGEADHLAMVRFEEMVAEFSQRVRDLGLTGSDLKPYYEAEDEEGLRQLLGYSQEWVDQRAAEIAQLEDQFYSDHPHMSDYEAPLGSYTNLAGHLDFIVNEGAFNIASDPMVCEKKVLVAYSVCMMGSPLVGLACIYLAMCTYCEGGVADEAC